MEHKGCALVIGGSRGIGKACALRLARSGFDIVLSYKSSEEQALEVKEEITKLGKRCDLLSFDVADTDECEKVLKEQFGKTAPDVLLHNAGITRDNLLLWMKKDQWNDVLRTNLDGFYNVVKPMVFNMLRAKKGRIIVVSSVSGEQGQAGQVNYSASKAGLIGAAKALAREVGKKGIIVNVVSPGVIETDMTDKFPMDKVLPLIPMGRIGTPEDVASVVDFLASEKNMYIHGQVISVNGGLRT
ncbi:3-oxoacyl-(acyl-carrier-protein) reductase [Desulfamplus magnetovallimortis]|uniref:3-oxoacyl-(Acyl-carrier-protein) reductase n=1 Tax=Desulfamplus magnetovallimortis TaxID=1246637 RepID=L0R4I6_9BACT|nr:3-oxoacyl-ACP reductase FabG [Desulfamplus magnetovallimortis]CCO06779.1 3-oxoacyl-(acyl-carrier-protein) reductase [Desulfamplus magnetovallimortis BW-1]SLM32830.1 3-oxoacyl-(acyl-carrier-protein) reductase [Desulfamplus magnetovallimortis]